MPTDFFNPAITSQVAVSEHQTHSSKDDTSDLVDAIKDTLLEGGWMLIDTLPAHGWFYTAIMKVIDPDDALPEEDREMAPCYGWIHYGGDPGLGAPIAGYDPYRQIPPVTCCFFAYGETTEIGADALAAAVTLCTPFDATFDSELTDEKRSRTYKLTAKEVGTGWNGFYFTGDIPGILTNAIPAWGGGYKLRSQTYRGQYLELTLTAESRGDASNGVRLSLVSSAETGQPAVTVLTTSPGYKYRIIADPYQFAVWAKDVDGDTGGSDGATACLASMPQIDEEKVTDLDNAAVFITSVGYISGSVNYGSNMRSSLTYSPCWCALNGGFMPADGNVGIACLRLASYDILTMPDLDPVIENPYVWGAPAGEEPFILGKLWDAVMFSSSSVGRDSVMQWGGVRYTCMGKQTGSFNQTSASLWMAVN